MMKKNRPILKSLLVLIGVLTVLVVFGLYMTSVANRAEQIGRAVDENFLLNVIKQAASIVILFLMGWLLLWPYKNKLGQTQVYLLSYLVGLLAFEMISSFLIIFIIRYTYLAVMAIYMAVLAFVYWRAVYKGQAEELWFKKGEGWTFVFWLIGTVALAAVLSYVPINVLSFDSVEYMSLGKMYASEGFIRDYYIYQISGHPFVPTLINSIAAFFRYDYAYALQNVFLVMSTLLFGWLLKEEIMRCGFKTKTAVWLSVFGTSVLAVNFFYLFLGVCLVPNIFAAYTLFFAAIYMYRYSFDESPKDIALSFIFMVAFCFSRVEGPLLAAIFMAYFAHTKLKNKNLLYYTGGLFAVVALWYLSFFVQSPANFDGQFLTVERSMMVAAAFLAIGLYIFLKEKFFSRYNRLLFGLFLGALGLGAIALNLLDMEKFINNITVMYQNMFFHGFWKITWLVMAAFGIVALLITKKREMFLEWMIPIILCFMLILFAYRSSPLHIYWSDSGNRMLLHIYPFCVFVLTLNILSAFAPERKQD
ncbi:MAG: hypothetical protein AB1Z19_07240 [Eubacteriales bacterium]